MRFVSRSHREGPIGSVFNDDKGDLLEQFSNLTSVLELSPPTPVTGTGPRATGAASASAWETEIIQPSPFRIPKRSDNGPHGTSRILLPHPPARGRTGRCRWSQCLDTMVMTDPLLSHI